MPLSDVTIRKAEPAEKQYKLYDDGGLFLIVHPNGSKYWRVRYRVNSKQKDMSIGVYPTVTLKEARTRRDKIRVTLAKGIDPACGFSGEGEIFEKIADKWLYNNIVPTRSPGHAETVCYRLKSFLYPVIGNKPIADIVAKDVLNIVLPIAVQHGKVETAHRVMQICGQVFRYAVANGLAERDVTMDLRGALPPVKERHHASLTNPDDMAKLLRAMSDFNGGIIIQSAIWFSVYTFARPGEIRHAEWGEFDINEALWKIPAEKMKLRRPHLVPLSRQVCEIIKHMEPLTGHGKYVFPATRNITKCDRPMSDGTVLAALRRMGYTKDEMTAHGFRSMASTNLNEQGWPPDVIERQLAHMEGNSVRAAYNYAQYLPERRRMMQAWTDYLDELKSRI